MPVIDLSIKRSRAIRSPVRIRMLEILMQTAPLSVAQIAARMGKAPIPLYHHVKVLLAAGMLRDAGIAGEGREAERLYAPAARGFRVKTKSMQKAARAEYASLGAAHARYALRRFTRAIEAGHAVMEGTGRNTLVRHLSVTLSPERLSELNRDLDAFAKKWAAAGPDGGAMAVSLAIVMGPHA